MLRFEHEELSLSVELEESNGVSKHSDPAEFTDNELKYAHWLYDTPGIVKEDCVSITQFFLLNDIFSFYER